MNVAYELVKAFAIAHVILTGCLSRGPAGDASPVRAAPGKGPTPPAVPTASAAFASGSESRKADCRAATRENSRPLFAWDTTGSRLAAFVDGSVKVWDPSSGAELLHAAVPAVITNLAWQSQRMLVATTPRSWHLLDTATGTVIMDQEVAGDGCDAALTIDPDGALVAYTLDMHGTIEVTNLVTRAVMQLRTLLPGALPVRWVNQSSGLAIRGSDGLVELWAYPSGARVWRCERCRGADDPGSEYLWSDTVSPDGRTAAVYRQPEDDSPTWLEIIQGESGTTRRIDEWATRNDPYQPLSPLAIGVVWSSDNRRAIVVQRLHIAHSPADMTDFRLYDAQSWKLNRSLGREGGTGTRVTCGFTRNDQWIWIQNLANSPLRMEIRDAATGSKLRAFSICGEIFPSHDGALGAELCQFAQLRDLTTGRVNRTLAQRDT